jgi:DNA-binding transcriptional ArsR family regulator
MLDDVLAALADPTRRAILRRLTKGDARVSDLARPFPISLNSVSKHIATLERAHLVRRRRSGREYIIFFDPRPLDLLLEWAEEQRAIWQARLTALDALLQTEDRASALERKRSGRPMTAESRGVIRLTHAFTVSAERVFDAWLRPEMVARWLLPYTVERVTRVEIDARVGGSRSALLPTALAVPPNL